MEILLTLSPEMTDIIEQERIKRHLTGKQEAIRQILTQALTDTP